MAARSLEGAQLDAIERLEAACLAVDGGRLKLEYPTLRRRPGIRDEDFLWVEDGEVVGFLGIYQFREDQAELCGMVHPGRRRAGIASRLLAAGTAELRHRNSPRTLLIVGRGVEGGEAFARAKGGELVSSEHRMILRNQPPVAPRGAPEVMLRDSTSEDAGFVQSCLADAFGLPPGPSAAEELFAGENGMLVITDGDERVGVMRVDPDGRSAGIYGFAVTPALQGRGYGQAALTAVCRSLMEGGVEEVKLEVSVVNPSALHVYERCGFEIMGTEDYYLIA